MRMRMLLAAVLLAVGAVLVRTGAATRVGSGAARRQRPSRRRSRHCRRPTRSASRSSRTGSKVDDCQKAPSPILPAKNELIWGTISFVVLFVLLWKFAWPGIKKGMDARTERIRDDLDAAEAAKTEAEHVLDDYQAQLADARNESARIIEEARQQADALRRDQEQRLQTELAEMRERGRRRRRGGQGPGHRRPPSRGRRRWPSAPPRSSSSATSTARRRCSWSRTTSTRSRAGRTDMSDVTQAQPTDRIGAYAEALFAVARAEGIARRGRGRAVPVRPRARGHRRAARRAHRPAHPGEPAPADRRGPARRQGATHVTTALVSMVVGTGRARELPTIIDSLVRKSAEAQKKAVAEVRSADRAHRRPASPARRRHREGHRQDGRGQGRSSTRPCSAASSPRSATRSSTARSAPASNNSRTRSRSSRAMAELTINTADIAAALEKNLEGFKPDMSISQVGRILEVGDGIARVSGLPDAAVNELLEFEDGTLGLALNLDEESIGAVVLGEASSHRRGPGGQGHRPHPVGARRRRPARPRRQRPRRADRRPRSAHQRRAAAAWRSRRPASPAASPCTSRCRPASRPSTR